MSAASSRLLFGTVPWTRVVALSSAILSSSSLAESAEPTAGYPEPVIQWGVQKGETCEAIAEVVYGNRRHAHLLLRYNRIPCVRGAPLATGLTLVLPAEVTEIPTARIQSMNREVQARAPGTDWLPAAPGQPLTPSSAVNSLETGRADIQFVDRSWVFIAENTLVVIYGTASQSQVSRNASPVVELQEGEVAAGLAALRGATIGLDVPGGGGVRASSRDTVVQRRGDRTTVAVFDGTAEVENAGRKVSIPTNHGSRFVAAKPPDPPRPLPPAPVWAGGGPAPIVLVDAAVGQGEVRASWEAVADARAYRVEIARDATFRDLIVREEVSASTRSLRAERLPAGAYHLRVRAIDTEDYLGIAAVPQGVRIVAARLPTGQGDIRRDVVRLNPFSILTFPPSEGVELQIDDGPFQPLPGSLDLARFRPHRLSLRAGPGGRIHTLRVEYRRVEARVEMRRVTDRRRVSIAVRFDGVEGIDVPDRIGPVARLVAGDQSVEGPLAVGAGGAFVTELAASDTRGPLHVDILDRRGHVLGQADSPSIAAPKTGAVPRLGLAAPPWVVLSETSTELVAPTAYDAASLSVALDRPLDAGLGVMGRLHASGLVDPLSVSASVRSGTLGEGRRGDERAWLGATVRALRLGRAELEMGPSLRVAVPTTGDGPAPALEPALAFAGRGETLGWIANAGGRVRLDDDSSRIATDAGQVFAVGGITLDAFPWLRTFGLVDAHVLFVDRPSTDVAGAGGLTLGAEAGAPFFAGLAARVSPFVDRDALVNLSLSIGVRAQ